MLIARESKEPTKAKFEIAYDLRVYNVLLGSDDSKLLLTPKDEKLNAQKVELVAETQNGTKRWFQTIKNQEALYATTQRDTLTGTK